MILYIHKVGLPRYYIYDDMWYTYDLKGTSLHSFLYLIKKYKSTYTHIKELNVVKSYTIKSIHYGFAI